MQQCERLPLDGMRKGHAHAFKEGPLRCGPFGTEAEPTRGTVLSRELSKSSEPVRRT